MPRRFIRRKEVPKKNLKPQTKTTKSASTPSSKKGEEIKPVKIAKKPEKQVAETEIITEETVMSVAVSQVPEESVEEVEEKKEEIEKELEKLVEEEPKVKEGIGRPKFPLLLVVIIILLFLISGAGFYLYQRQAEKPLFNGIGNAILGSKASDPQTQVASLLSKVSGHILPPSSETPTVMTVSDVTKLQGQQFFAHAQNGDKVLIYASAKKAILYRPSIDKVIDIAPVSIAQESTPTPTPDASSAAKLAKVDVEIYNGTKTVGLTKTVEKQLTGVLTNVEVVDRDNASKSDYEETIVVDLSGKYQKEAEEIAKTVHGQVGSLPKGETKPKADILIIAGSDYASSHK